MKKKNRMGIALLATVILTASVWPQVHVEAGESVPVLDSGTLENTSKWNNAEEDIVIKDGRLIFPKESTEYTRIISKSEAVKNDYFTKLVAVEGDLKLTQLPAGKNFILAMGLSEIESLPGEGGNVEVTFSNDQGIRVSVVAVGEDKEAVTVCEPVATGIALNTVASIKAEIEQGVISVSVNGRTVCTGELPVTGEGKVGFMQTGECGAELTDIKVTFYSYDRPENCDVEENFEEGSLNVSKLILKTITTTNYFPQGNSIEELNGNKVLLFENSGGSYLGTRYTYSNFAISFDVPYLLTKDKYDDSGSVSAVKTESFAISFGAEKKEWSSLGYDSAKETVLFEGEKVYSLNQKETQTAENPYWSAGEFSVKLSVIDGKVNVGFKGLHETEYKTLLDYVLSDGTPVGYVQLWIPSAANMAIDNLVICNMDDSPNLLELDFKSAALDVKDVAYEPFERVYAEGTSQNESQRDSMSRWYLLIPAAVVAGILALTVTGIVGKVKEKNGGDGK